MKVYLKIDKAIEGMSKFLSYVGAAWIFLLMAVIAIDVIGRQAFDMPFTGTSEIVRNSVAGIAFVLIPWAMVKDTHVRSTIIVDRAPKKAVLFLDTLAYGIGFLIFVAIVISSWDPFVQAFITKAYEGEGAMRIVTWPIRAAIIVGCTLTAWHSLKIIITKIFPDRFVRVSEGGLEQ